MTKADVRANALAPSRNYPLVCPYNDDPRFTLGLAIEVQGVLERRGYPKLSADDFGALQRALLAFLYPPSDEPAQRYEGRVFRAASGQWSWAIDDHTDGVEIVGGAGYESEDEAFEALKVEIPSRRV